MKTKRLFALALSMCLYISASSYQTNAQVLSRKDKNRIITPGITGSVIGGGTVGRISKWSGVTGTNTFVLDDSNLFEDKFGKIGIGTTTPTSLLTVQGMIETTLGGLKFPDGTVQTSAGIAADQVVKSLNGLRGDLTLVPGSNIAITPGTNSLTIEATGFLDTVNHNTTLVGNGTSGSPLGVSVPLVLSGFVNASGVIQATNTALGNGIIAKGGDIGSATFGGFGVIGTGGNNGNGIGGAGLAGMGGNSDSGRGGNGVSGIGGIGTGAGNSGGRGIEGTGGIGMNGATQGLAGKFNGNVQVTGTLSQAVGSLKIDHPLDPEGKYLNHSFVESPDMMNIYNGNITTNEIGEALVTMPAYFDALNRDFRYQLTVIGTFAQAIVADEIKGNRFVIKTDVPNVKVSWQVTGIRQDAFANQNRITIEEAKPAVERGYYLHPEVFNQPEEKSVNWARNPEMMRQLQQRRLGEQQLRKDQSNQQ